MVAAGALALLLALPVHAATFTLNPSADSAVSYLCYSGNNTGSRPFLSVVAVPEPQAFFLLVTGAIFLCSAKCRRGNQQG